MHHINVEIKARCVDPNRVEAVLLAHGARFIGEDHQIDTYFCAAKGRLKLREGTIENNWIFYHRTDQAGPKTSAVTLLPATPDSPFKTLLTEALGIRVIVDKRRRIFFIDNVKFHLDVVKGLGTFVEIEAIQSDTVTTQEALRAQCAHYMHLLDIPSEALLKHSYSDMLLEHIT